MGLRDDITPEECFERAAYALTQAASADAESERSAWLRIALEERITAVSAVSIIMQRKASSHASPDRPEEEAS